METEFSRLWKNLSVEAQMSITENQFTPADVADFSDDDVAEFPSQRDRFFIRKYRRSVMPSSNINDQKKNIDPNQNVMEECQTESSSISSSIVESVDMDCQRQAIQTDSEAANKATFNYTAEQLLLRRPKKKKGSSPVTEAQSYFSSLLKDSAKNAHIWKRAPCLYEISEKQRSLFLKGIVRGAPMLDVPCFLDQVWSRLGQSLENRRKYLRDLASGKKLSKKPRENIAGLNSGSIPPLSSNYNPADVVNLLSKDKVSVIGKGLLIMEKDEIFSELVLTDLFLENTTLSEEDVELPIAIFDQYVLSKKLIKKKIQWRTDRLKSLRCINAGSTPTSRKGQGISTPSTSKGHGTPSTSKGHGTPSTSKGHGTPSTSKGHGTPSTSKGHGTPSTSKGHGTPSTSKGHGTPSTSKGHSTPSTSKGHGTPSTSKGHGTPSTSKGHGTPSTSKGHVTPSNSKGHVTPSTSKGHGTPLTSKGHGTLSTSKGHDTPSTSKGHGISTLSSSGKLPNLSKNSTSSSKFNDAKKCDVQQKGKKRKVDSTSPIAKRKKTDSASEDSILSVFEWENGNLYIGMLDDNAEEPFIINCLKPIGKVHRFSSQLAELHHVDKLTIQMLKLNKKDIQKYPDTRYKIMSSAFYCIDSLTEMFIIEDEDGFFEQLRSAFDDYRYE